ncbi:MULTISPECIES: holo-ACP synthase [Neobacillus]|uniref:Holo-[acyl-carrier-protein] synthase n=1 Tax=Neobacillus rhizosphaerae TaxID=2880965 RepID=A0ABN8KMT0_9BACI|nr:MULTISPECIES: holo-ACP synthase [Neobacillus]CAH2714507.1 Holo-[acyl-carrier-protein] synthase [Neobacillus rhizosphaerae]
MIKGIGIDIIELSRVQEIINRQRKFVDRVLTSNEKGKFEELSEHRKVEFLAGRFAAKEAFSKAAGTGIGKELSFLDIEIGTDDSGKPFFAKPDVPAHLSISHSRDYAVAQVVIEE